MDTRDDLINKLHSEIKANAALRGEVERIRTNTNDSIQTLGKRIRQLEDAVEWALRTCPLCGGWVVLGKDMACAFCDELLRKAGRD